MYQEGPGAMATQGTFATSLAHGPLGKRLPTSAHVSAMVDTQ